MFGGLHAKALREAIVAECGSLAAFDGFVGAGDGTQRRAAPVGSVAIVASATTIGIALVPAIFALCAGCDVVVRDRDDELVAAFGAGIAEEDPQLAERLKTVVAAAHDEPAWLAALQGADALVAFGGEAALRALRNEVRGDARILAYPHRTSIAYVTREALATGASARACAAGLARDALLYDGDGCLSAHVAFVERGAAIATEQFAGRLREALERTAVEFPVGARDLAASLAGAHAAARFRAALGTETLQCGDAGRFLLSVDPPALEGPPLIPRALALRPVDAPREALEYVRTHALGLEAFAVPLCGTRDDVVAAALASGAARIARIGSLQDPSFAAPHGGFGRITPFVRWISRDP